MARTTIDDSILTSVADSIRAKTETTESISPLYFADMIDSISGGGELPDNMIIGEFTPQTNLETYTVSHDKGKTPYLAVCFAENIDSETTPYAMVVAIGIMSNNDGGLKGNSMLYNGYSGNTGSFVTNYTSVSEMTDTSVTFSARGGSYTYKTGVTYQYILMFSEV